MWSVVAEMSIKSTCTVNSGKGNMPMKRKQLSSSISVMKTAKRNFTKAPNYYACSLM